MRTVFTRWIAGDRFYTGVADTLVALFAVIVAETLDTYTVKTVLIGFTGRITLCNDFFHANIVHALITRVTMGVTRTLNTHTRGDMTIVTCRIIGTIHVGLTAFFNMVRYNIIHDIVINHVFLWRRWVVVACDDQPKRSQHA